MNKIRKGQTVFTIQEGECVVIDIDNEFNKPQHYSITVRAKNGKRIYYTNDFKYDAKDKNPSLFTSREDYLRAKTPNGSMPEAIIVDENI